MGGPERAERNRGERPPVTGRGGKLTFDIPSDFESAREVQRSIMEQVSGHGYDADSVFAIRLALEEAIANAIKHGNRRDPAKKVHVEARVTPDRAEILVRDEGAGFNRHVVPDCTARHNLSRPSGRGILLIESYMTHAQWDQGGRRVRMVRENVKRGA